MYFDSVGDPVCIVGHVLHELGARYEGESVVSADGAHVSASWAQAIHLFWDVLGVHEGTFEQSRWVQNVQTNQDLGYSWSGAICNAHDSALVPA